VEKNLIFFFFLIEKLILRKKKINFYLEKEKKRIRKKMSKNEIVSDSNENVQDEGGLKMNEPKSGS
jgi:hypothetical protein